MNNKITIHDGKLKMPDHVTIPFIEGYGIGMDISKPAQNIVDAAVAKS
jgi:isocitrate dehydrogenase